MALCNRCNKFFRVPEDEQDQHACPHCGLTPEEAYANPTEVDEYNNKVVEKWECLICAENSGGETTAGSGGYIETYECPGCGSMHRLNNYDEWVLMEDGLCGK